MSDVQVNNIIVNGDQGSVRVTLPGLLIALAFFLIVWKVLLVSALLAGLAAWTLLAYHRSLERKAGLALRCDEQNAMVLAGDERGIYGI